jgi:heme/copper-type cytochrome/quinol oxidase subunit 3
MKASRSLLLTVLFSLLLTAVLAQSGAEVREAIDDEWNNNWKPILRLITTIIIAIGGIGLAYAYGTNRQESKDHLTKWVIALVIIGVLRVTVLS